MDKSGTAAGSDADSPPSPPVMTGGRREYWIAFAASLLLRLLVLTLRIRVADPARLRRMREGGVFIPVFWHNRLLLIPVVWNRFFARHRPVNGMALTSTSRDGELIAQFLRRFRLEPIRGSATRRGSTALREIVRFVRRGHDVGITPDGSRGPVYEIKGGLVLLAQLTGTPVLPFSFEYSSAWRLKTWDRFVIPKPFSRVTFILGGLHTVRRTGTPEEFEAERARCQEAMLAVVRER